MKPAIVIIAYNRPQALLRLLDSVKKGKYPAGSEICLHISIDRGEAGHNEEVVNIAQQFKWDYGPKRVICQEHPLGLVEHFYHCGNLSQDYGSIILLEDDLVVSPVAYAFASQALDYYQHDRRIAGFSLYALSFNGYTHNPFMPLLDETDIFFLQIPYTQGQAFSDIQWKDFTFWLGSGNRSLTTGDNMHEMFYRYFDPDEWFPIRTKYLIETRKYYVFPRESLSTGFGDAGTHFSHASSYFQIPLQNFKETYRLKEFDKSVAIYDSFFEILPERLNQMTGDFKGYDYDVDLYGTKSLTNIRAEYVLTSRRCRSSLFSYGKRMYPLEANVINAVPGEDISFCKKSDIVTGKLSEIALRKGNYDYFTRRHLGKRQHMQFLIIDLLNKLGWQTKK